MKNIHLIPTEKASMIIQNNLGLTRVTEEFTQSDLDFISAKFVNIYITYDETPKHLDWYFCFENKKVKKCETGYYNKGSKKIILTTDPDLIADGVQAIDDEFLEWFVKNPSCEFVEIKKGCKIGCDKFILNGVNSICCEDKEYKIIIPKEEPKQECCQDVSGFCLGTTCPKCNTPFRSVIQEPKQEIIATEEDAKIFVDNIENPPAPNEKLKTAFGRAMISSTKNEAAEKWCSEEGFYPDPKQGFIAGADWEQEQNKNKYSEEEVIAFVKWMYDYKADINKVEELFKQFKNK